MDGHDDEEVESTVGGYDDDVVENAMTAHAEAHIAQRRRAALLGGGDGRRAAADGGVAVLIGVTAVAEGGGRLEGAKKAQREQSEHVAPARGGPPADVCAALSIQRVVGQLTGDNLLGKQGTLTLDGPDGRIDCRVTARLFARR